ncbi:hypothetical protein [Niallia sp. RD1]|uniref:hypothetical protein n=1 Tax=Niallia sp. RD1 TaxID=2962858 RepID=UPI0020C1B776|nr:hypothetical protein [Niallia sp. RD1]UTI42093.1 hypothetical protein NKG37_25320 [Niallia sp. RD1]
MIIGLIGNYNFKGIPLTNAFARIDTVESYDTHATASVNIYVNKEAFETNQGYLEQIYPVKFEKQIGDTVGDDRTQGYRFVKTMTQFQSWEEVTA